MTQPSDSFDRLLNVGCGRCYHTSWTNIDLVACGPEVRQYDLRRGLPYEDDSFDAVYHSHVLEHLSPEDARTMLLECQRVLRSGGVLRVAVPDLEGIAKAYLNSIRDAEGGDEYALANHRWMTLELIDQLARQRGGGQMGQLMRDPNLINLDFVRSRIGGEMGQHKNGGVKKTFLQRCARAVIGLRKQIALAALTLLDGASGRAAYREGRFRQAGEIHRWMYDRISLSAVLQDLGFEQIDVCDASLSRITGFDSYQLDRDEQQVPRKPDSMYLEGVKRAATGQAVAAGSASKAA